MTYYQLLKSRRIDLNLSIQDISMQTHLKPEYIRAIEENNLDLFSDDLSYVRYFVRGYCDAIGVNWQIIQPHVDKAVSDYAAARDQAMARAQDKMLQSMSASKPSKQSTRKSRQRRKRAFLQNSAGKASRMLGMNTDSRLTKIILAGAFCAVAAVFAFSVWTENAYEKASQAAAAERVEMLKEKEEKTQQMAEQLKGTKEAETVIPLSALTIEQDPQEEGTWWVIGDFSANPQIDILSKSSQEQSLTIYVNGSPVFTQTSTADAAYSLANAANAEIKMAYQNINYDLSITMNGAGVPMDISALQQEDITVLTFKTASSLEEAGLADENSEEQSEEQVYDYEQDE
jgi:cytoskeletal protein RodZ